MSCKICNIAINGLCAHDLYKLLRIEQECSTCAGVPHVSGLICVCGDTNSHTEEILGLRREIIRLERLVEEMERDLETC